MNEVLFFVTILINFIGIILSYKFFKKIGLFVWIGFATVVSNIEVTKCVTIFGLPLTLGNVIYGTIFLATDILSEIYGGKEARKGVLIGFFTMIMFTILSQINLLYVPNEQDFVSSSMKVIFAFMPRLCFASMITYLISNTFDTFLYDFIRKHSPNTLWLRNNLSTITSQLLDSFLFTFLSFVGVFDWNMLFILSLTTYLVKVIIALCDTPFLYFAKFLSSKEKNKVPENSSET